MSINCCFINMWNKWLGCTKYILTVTEPYNQTAHYQHQQHRIGAKSTERY